MFGPSLILKKEEPKEFVVFAGNCHYINQGSGPDCMNSAKLKTLLGVACLFLSLSTTAKADGVTFSNLVALQNNGTTQIDLYTNPQAHLFGSQISFFVDLAGVLPASGSDTLRLTFLEAGQNAVVQNLAIPFFSGLTLPYTQLFTFTPIHPTVAGTPVILSVDIVGNPVDFVIPSGPGGGTGVNSYSYSFLATTPVPEPISGSLFLLGVSAVVARARRHKPR
jgi:hypothetical protein